MSRFITSVFAGLLILGSAAASAQSLDDLDKILLPLTPERVQGAFGSDWLTDLAVTNLGTAPIAVYGYQPAGGCPTQCAPEPPIAPGATIFIYTKLRSALVNGGFLWVEAGRSGDLALTLRSRDLSRGHETWGTVVPVVRAAELRSGRFGMTDIPIGQRFRAMLRVYDADARTAPRARLRVYRVDSERDFPRTPDADPLLLDREITFSVPDSDTTRLFYPGYAEVPLWTEPALSGATRVRVEIEPLTGQREYWGFVTITHNDTQHVTVLQP